MSIIYKNSAAVCCSKALLELILYEKGGEEQQKLLQRSYVRLIAHMLEERQCCYAWTDIIISVFLVWDKAVVMNSWDKKF